MDEKKDLHKSAFWKKQTKVVNLIRHGHSLQPRSKRLLKETSLMASLISDGLPQLRGKWWAPSDNLLVKNKIIPE